MAASVLAFGAGVVARAAEPPETTGVERTGAAPTSGAELDAEGDGGQLSLELAFDVTTGYFYRGFRQEDGGLIAQPSASLGMVIHEEGDFGVGATLGTWSSLHSRKTGAEGDGPGLWYEADFIAGLSLTKGAWLFETTYVYFTSPSRAFTTIQELDFTLAFDDEAALGRAAMHPYVLLGIETDGASDGGESGMYVELGISPGFAYEIADIEMIVVFPIALTLSLDDYYEDEEGNDERFGAASAGVDLSMPLPFGNSAGDWTIHMGVTALALGDHAASFNDGDNFQVIATIGLAVEF